MLAVTRDAKTPTIAWRQATNTENQQHLKNYKSVQKCSLKSFAFKIPIAENFIEMALKMSKKMLKRV